MTPDFRITLPGPRIDFNALGVNTGQDIANFPAPGSQARYDWMRSVVMGLLAQQASFSPPTQYTDGTPWFDLNSLTLKIRRSGAWVSYADAIPLTEPDSNGDVVSLAEWYAETSELLVGVSPEIVFSGTSTADGVTQITVPTSLQAHLSSDSKVFLYINGGLVSPLNCTLIGSPPTTIALSGAVISAGDTFVVSIRRIGATTYLPTTIVVP